MASLPPRVPDHLADMLDTLGIEPTGQYSLGIDSPSQWSDGFSACEGAKYHSPMPLVLHLVSLHPTDRTNRSREALLCAVCIDNLRTLQRLQVASNNDIPWPVLREFANQIRALARRGWEMMGVCVHCGEGLAGGPGGWYSLKTSLERCDTPKHQGFHEVKR